MKNLMMLLVAIVVLSSCNKDDGPTSQPLVKVIDKIEIKVTSGNFPSTISKTLFSYNVNKEISKIEYIIGEDLFYSYTYSYLNNIPVASMYDFPGGGDPVYEVTYGYTDGQYSSYYDTLYDTTIVFSFEPEYNQYTNNDTNSKFILNGNNDVVSKTLSTFGNTYTYTFDTTKKGPLFNVVNKEWIPVLWFGSSNERINCIATHPVNGISDFNLAQTNPYVNSYDADGFVIKSVFTINNGTESYEITYTYKSI